MLGIMNHVILTATGAKEPRETAIQREYRIRHAERLKRAEARDELRRRIYSKISL
ncbi:MAG: hypothetical protein VX874_04070 [Pseudomonadota bacterium]|nr:hypothetical protein [Pseudomonadota bacterium]